MTTDQPFEQLAEAVPPHEHPELRPIGQMGVAQSVPVWAVNSSIDPSSIPKLIAVHLTIPPGTPLSKIVVGALMDSTSPEGLWSATVYDGVTTLPIATAVRNQFNARSSRHERAITPTIPPSDTARQVWVMLAITTTMASLAVVNTLGSQRYMGGLCYSTNTYDRPPARFDDRQGWQDETRIPLVALA
ncbi:hypothetical protein AB0L53_31680 [Nonomuraea sp. NPDC052129]|uniref:hypothetical protein n=1 Tax=Nonomuraea sp. NPDC052129 TaxID=3154651 RepID=UPI003416FF04